MSAYLSSLPLWISALIVVAIPTIIAMSGPAVIRRRISLERLTTNNEIAGFKFATVGVIYAVLIAFAVIIVWERFSEGEAAVLQEAGSAATLYRLTSGTQTQEIAATRNAMSHYLKVAVERDWPAMAEERESREATGALNDLYAAAIRLAEKGTTPQPILMEIFKQLDSITQARRTRLQLATGIVPEVLWIALTLGALLTIGFTFFFGTENLSAQIMMTGILSTLVLMGLLVIVSIDHPFTGPVHIESTPLENIFANFGS